MIADKTMAPRYTPVMPVCITAKARATMIAAAARAHPFEACGILLGQDLGAQATSIDEARPCANVAADRSRHFEIDPAALIAAHRAARDGGARVLGYWHSHPTGLAAPSATDAAMAARDGRIWAIVAAGIVTLWRDGPSGFEPLCYDVRDG